MAPFLRSHAAQEHAAKERAAQEHAAKERAAQERARLRDIYIKNSSFIVQKLDTKPQAVYSHSDLTELGITLESFDPDDQNFIASKSCLFKPLSPESFEEFRFEDSELPDGTPIYVEFDESFNNPEFGFENESPSTTCFRHAEDIETLLDLFYESSIRGTEPVEKSLEPFLCEYSHWDHIKDGNTFLNGPRGLIMGINRPGLPYWKAKGVREWRENEHDPATARPHIMLLLCTGTEAKEGELIFAELGSIAQTMQRRLAQKEFVETSLFPVLAISLFGPRHGRILQARFTPSGVLKIRASTIHNFVKRDDAPFSLYLRYLACEPKDGVEYEFFDEEEDKSTQTAVKQALSPEALVPSSEGALAPSSGAQRAPSSDVRRARSTKIRSAPSPTSDKENRPPEADSPSTNDSEA